MNEFAEIVECLDFDGGIVFAAYEGVKNRFIGKAGVPDLRRVPELRDILLYVRGVEGLPEKAAEQLYRFRQFFAVQLGCEGCPKPLSDGTAFRASEK